MERTELLKSKEYWMENLQNLLYQEVKNYMAVHGITKTMFAEQLKVSKSYVSQVLNGDFDHKLSKFVELTLATGNVPLLKFKNIDEYLVEDACTHDYLNVQGSFKRPTQFLKNSNDLFIKLGNNLADCDDCTPPGPLGKFSDDYDEMVIIPYEEIC